jgi:NADH-quinone oxidoreductase subunit N
MMLMGSATDLLSIFIALEIMSIPIYVLVGFKRDSLRAREASFKYFILGAVSSGIFVYGAALVYGGVGTTNITVIAEKLVTGIILRNPVFLLGAAFVICGFLFKVSAVPFHMWTPDVYEGANLPITAYMSVGVKAAAFSAFVRFAVSDLTASGDTWIVAIAVIAVATMILGNTAALAQNNLKRLFAYSSIAHVGYILVALIAGSEYGVASILFYLLIYVVTNLGIFSFLIYFSKKEKECESMGDLAGLGYGHPIMAVSMGIFLFSLAGIPPTGGFMGKLFLFIAAVEGGYVGLVVVAVIASGVSVYYYLRVMMALFEKGKGKAKEIKNPYAGFVVILAALITLYLGIMPGHFMELARFCAGVLF